MAHEQLVVHVAQSIAPPDTEPGTAEFRFWLRVARKAIEAVRASRTHALVGRWPDYEVWLWDDKTKELVPRVQRRNTFLTPRPPREPEQG